MARCFVTGAYGFIGRYLVQELTALGFEVIGGGRDLVLGRRLLPELEWVAVDFNKDDRAAVWLPRLAGVDVVINCAGILQSTFWDDADKIHRRSTIALFEACAQAGVSRLIHISAMSAEDHVSSDYAASKTAADEALAQLHDSDGEAHGPRDAAQNRISLAARNVSGAPATGSTSDTSSMPKGGALNWVIVKPSIVVAQGCHGGTAMIRGLAGFPFVTPLPAGGSQTFQPIAMTDLVRGLANLAGKQTPARTVLFAAGPQTLSLRQVVACHRRWLGFAPARNVSIPKLALAPFLKLGDLLGYIGNGSAMRTTSMVQMEHLGHADPAPFAQGAEVSLRPLATALAATPSTLQDRLHARSVFILPAAQGVIALFWILTGLITLLPGPSQHAALILTQGGLPAGFAAIVVTGGAALDIVLGVLFIPYSWMRLAGALQLALSTAYLLGAAVLRPDLWLDPLGPLLKVLPLMAATLLVMALNEKR